MLYRTYKTNRTYKPGNKPGLIPLHGGYKKLLSYQMAAIIYDLTVIFTDKYINKFSRTKDQMVQAARSGKQNIAEGSQVSGTSKKTELKLVGVARASLAELLDDCEDFLRQREFGQWGKNSVKARKVRALAYRSNKSYTTYKSPESGQALLELVVVMAILVLVLVALVSLVILSLATIQKSRLRARAASVAQDGMERIRAKRDEDRYVNNWTSSGPTPGFKQDCPLNARDWAYGAPAPTINPTVFPTVSAGCTPVPTPDQVHVETKVGWKFSGKWHDVTLETEFGPRQKGIFR